MFGFGTKQKAKESRISGTDNSDSHVTTINLRPNRRLLLDRSLSFFINSEHISVAAARHFGPYRTVEMVQRTAIPEDLSRERIPNFLAETVGTVLEQHAHSSATIQLAIAGEGTALRTFNLPVLKRSDLASAVAIEAKSQLPFPVSDCRLAYRPIQKVTSGKRHRYRLAVHAATNRLMQNLLAPFQRNNATISAAHSGHDLVGDLLTDMPDFDPNSFYTVLRIGRSSTETAFYHGASVEFAHQGSTGVEMLAGASDEKRIEFLAETLATQIQSSYDYYVGQQAVTPARRIFVCGTGHRHPRLLKRLGDILGYDFVPFPVETLVRFRRSDGIVPELLVDNLIAVAGAANRSKWPDLLPEPLVEYNQNKVIHRRGRLATATVLVILAASWAFSQQTNSLAQNEVNTLKHRVEVIRSSDAFRTYETLQANISAANQYMARVEKEPTFTALNLKELSHITPREVRLTRFDLNPADSTNNLRIYGVVLTDDIPPEVILAEFVEQLNASMFYSNVTVERHVKRVADERFELDFQLKLGGRI